jgi:hypothetical protein
MAISEVFKPSKENIQQFKTKHIFPFSFLWVSFVHQDPDPFPTKINANPDPRH